jgi:hypothetical protein
MQAVQRMRAQAQATGTLRSTPQQTVTAYVWGPLAYGACRVGHEVVRKVWIVCMAVEGELQDPSPRHLEFIAQRAHGGRNQTQIFSDEW